jgi:hypothetical protein
MNKRIQIVSATKHDQITDTILAKCLKKYCPVGDNLSDAISYSIKTNNRDSLAKVYNKEIENPYNKNKILVFVHDDVIIEELFLQEKLNEAMELYDIVGLAGIKAPITIKEPCLWHLMGPASQYSGAVAHFDKNETQRFMTSFGKTPERVILLDGVFLAINTKKILEKGLRFDEKNPANFHFYDLNFSLDANNLKLKLGTCPIWITHKSHGLEQVTEDWINGQKYFLQKYNGK